MKIEINLPEWVEEKHIYIMAGIELVAKKYLGQLWEIKTSRCISCGKCCGDCKHLKNNQCSLALERPFRCCITNGKEYCKEKFNTML